MIEIFQSPTLVNILADYENPEDPDTRGIWAAVKSKMTTSMAVDVMVANAIKYITSVHLTDGSWRGSQEAFFVHFRKTCHTINQYQPKKDRFSDGQLIVIAQVAVTGMKHLEDVLTNHLNTLKVTHSANGTINKDSITFSEYMHY